MAACLDHVTYDFPHPPPTPLSDNEIVPHRFLPVFLGAALVTPVFAATSPALQISSEFAPAGGWTQIKIYATKPAAISSGLLILNLDATTFGPNPQVGLFGANADASGVAAVSGSQVNIQFSSPSGGIGQLAGVPVLVISVPVLATASGRTVAVTATSPDPSLTVLPGSVTVNGSLSVQKIPAGMGIVPAGTVVPVLGSGFTPSTTVSFDAVAIASSKFVSANEIDLTLGGAAELLGKIARVRDSGTEFDYFCFQPNDPVNSAANSNFAYSITGVQPLFPVFASAGFRGSTSEIGGVIYVQNPNPTAASVTVTSTNNCCGFTIYAYPTSLSIPAGSWAIFDGRDDSSYTVVSDVPVRVLGVEVDVLSSGVPVEVGTVFPYDPNTLGLSPPSLIPSALAFSWQTGTALPAPRTVSVSFGSGLPVAVTAAVASGSSWLSVSPGSAASFSPTLSVSVNPSQLTAGTYQGSIVVTESDGPAATLNVSLAVTSAPVPQISVDASSLTFTAPATTATPYSQTINVTSNSGPAPFSVALPPGTWLKVSPMSGTTPATLTVTWDPAITSQIYYQQRSTPGSFLISGPGNAITVQATFNVTGVQTFQTFLAASGTGPNGLVFVAQAGSAPPAQTISVDPAGSISATADQPWISLAVPTPSSGPPATVNVTVNPGGLAPGTYRGNVTVSEPGQASASVPITLDVWSTAAAQPLTISSGNLTFIQTVGEPGVPSQSAQVTSGDLSVPITLQNGTSWLSVNFAPTLPTPLTVQVSAYSPFSPLGEYDGSFTLQSPGGLVYAPVTLLIEPGPFAPPVVSQVVNSASGMSGGVSPGEILTVRGYGAGASQISGLKLDASGNLISSLNGLQVTFDGKAAPLIYTSAYQTNLIVPYEVAGQTSTVMQVVYAAASGTLRTASWVLPVAATAPAIFTLDSTGTGQGAVVNQDGTINGPANPAARGSIVSIYATGEGQTSPAGVTGSVTQSNTRTPLASVTVTIGGLPATTQYVGSAPDAVAGLLQINAYVPQGVPPGPAVPVTITIGKIPSPPVTIAVN